jgi:hypothetical protein
MSFSIDRSLLPILLSHDLSKTFDLLYMSYIFKSLNNLVSMFIICVIIVVNAFNNN